jgi:serine/threonine protein phosphatase PrpC
MALSDHGRCPNPACGELVGRDDRFCEACGQVLPTWSVLVGLPLAAAAGSDTAVASGTGDREHIEVAFSDLAGVSDRGLKRQRNEDAMGLARLAGPGARVLVVCDGVSTSAEPAAAARVAAAAARDYLVAAVQDRHPNLEDAMREAIAAAQAAVSSVRYTRGDLDEPPASTLVAALVKDGVATIGCVGDSRAYFVTPTEAWTLSRDDSWAVEQVELGLLSEEAAGADPRAHALTRWLGADHEEGPLSSVSTFKIPANGCLLLCSDGLWNCAPAAERIRELVAEFPADATPLEVAQGLTEFARSLGGNDNITVVVAFV